MTLVVGLTGGIGSGKSTIAQFFQALGAPIIDADVIAKELVAKGEPCFTKVIEHFGAGLLLNDGEINRARLRELVFNQATDRKWLEDLLHPAIATQVKQKLSKVNYPYCIVIIPLLAEKIDTYKTFLDHILVVDVPEAQQLSWTINRDNCSKELVQKIIQTQATREQRLQIADTVLPNEGSLDALKNKIQDLHQLFLMNARPLS